MNYRNEKLKKTSDDIFQESDPPKDRTKPLEWRRNFNFIKLTLKNIKIINGFNVHEKEFDLSHGIHGSIKQIKPDIKTTVILTGELDEELFRDTIYVAVENKVEKDIFSMERPKALTYVTLKSSLPTKAEENRIPEGLYWGSVFRMNYDFGEGNLAFELSIPVDQMDDLITALREDENSTVEIGAQLLSFTFEVDDFFREHNHPRDIIINDVTQCFV